MMKKYLFGMASLALVLTLFSCEKKGESFITACSEDLQVSDSMFQDGPRGFHSVIAARIEGNCLHLTMGASGCSGSSWKIDLVASEGVMESMPPQRNMRIALENFEACQAYITRDLQFDIRPAQLAGENRVVLNLENFEDPLVYTY